VALAAALLLVAPAHARIAQIQVFAFPSPRELQHPSEFFPDLVVVDVGDTVRWVWVAGEHTTTSGDIDACEPDGIWSAPVSESTARYERVFEVPGIYHYFCVAHCDQAMTGAVAVKGLTPSRPASWGRIKARFER
jgi:hypothetical protein